MEKFKTTYGDTITKHEVVKETEKQIVFIHKWLDFNNVQRSKEIRESKETSYTKWHDTFEDAKNYLIEKAEKNIKNLEFQLSKAKEMLLRIKS